MKLKDLLPISQIQEAQGDALCVEYFRKFSESCDYNALFDYVGVKDDIEIYTADLTNFGYMSMIISKAYLVAKVTKKHAMFGLVYVLNGLEKLDATVCKITRKEKDGHVNLEYIKFDAEDKKNFSGEDVKFKNVIK